VNISEMHISVQHGVDKINSMHSDILLPEEIDLELNKNILRFINTRFNPRGNRYQKGFEMSQKRIDDLRSLIVEQSMPTIYKGHVFDNTWIDASFLPIDYLYLINMKSLVRQDKCKKLCWAEATTQMRPIEFILDVDILHHTLPNSFTSHFGAFIGYEPANSTGSPPLTPITTPYAGIYDTASALKSFLLYSGNWLVPGMSIMNLNTGINKVVVTFPIGFNLQVNFLGVLWNNGTGSTAMDASETDDAGGNANPSSLVFDSNAYWAAKRTPCDDQDFTQTVGINEFAQHDDIYKLLQDPFNKTKYKSPLFTMKENYVEIYTDDTFIVQDIKITYLRKPETVDNGNSINCDLPDHTHQEIVDMTVSTILEELSDPRYQSSNIEILKSE